MEAIGFSKTFPFTHRPPLVQCSSGSGEVALQAPDFREANPEEIPGSEATKSISTSQSRKLFALDRVNPKIQAHLSLASPLPTLQLKHQPKWQTANQDPAHRRLPVMGPQEDEADHLGDVMTMTAIEIIETAAIDHEVVAASSGRKSAEMIAKEARKD